MTNSDPSGSHGNDRWRVITGKEARWTHGCRCPLKLNHPLLLFMGTGVDWELGGRDFMLYLPGPIVTTVYNFPEDAYFFAGGYFPPFTSGHRAIAVRVEAGPASAYSGAVGWIQFCYWDDEGVIPYMAVGTGQRLLLGLDYLWCADRPAPLIINPPQPLGTQEATLGVGLWSGRNLPDWTITVKEYN